MGASQGTHVWVDMAMAARTGEVLGTAAASYRQGRVVSKLNSVDPVSLKGAWFQIVKEVNQKWFQIVKHVNQNVFYFRVCLPQRDSARTTTTRPYTHTTFFFKSRRLDSSVFLTRRLSSPVSL